VSGPQRRTWFVPGRIEVLGKHTDYAGGRSLTCATEQGIRISAAARNDPLVTVADRESGQRDEFILGPDVEPRPGEWSNYARTVARRLTRNFPGLTGGAEITFHSTLPRAAGLSSSSVLIVGFYRAIAAMNELEEHPLVAEHLGTSEALAGYLGCVENGASYGPLEGDHGVGTSGGSQDHTAILCSEAGCLKQYSFAPIQLERTVLLPAGYVFAIGVSGVSAEKTRGARDQYNRAATLAATVLERARGASGRAEETLAAALASAPDALARIRGLVANEPDLLQRLDQFAEESERLVPAAAAAIAAGDFVELGSIADRSHGLAIDKLQNQVPETVALQRLARSGGAVAASAFGAGFGGSVWALVEHREIDAFLTRWREAYVRQFPERAPRATFLWTRAAAGAREEAGHHA
jgi:galactokinase